MATNSVPSVVIELDRPRRMTLTLGAIRRIREATGKGLEALDAMQEDPDAMLDTIDGILWATLAGEDPDLTRGEVGEMLHIGNLGVASDKLIELIELSFPADPGPLEETPEKKPAKRAPAKAKGKKPSTSKSSGRSAATT